jgi:site-specific recombinase XerD
MHVHLLHRSFLSSPAPGGCHHRNRQRKQDSDPGWLDDVVRVKRPERLPTVLTHQEVEALLAVLDGASRTVGMLLYGSELRLTECPGLRVKNIDFTRSEILVRQGKGDKDRVTML